MTESGPAGPMVEVRDLSKHYGSVRAVDGISFAVEAGEVLELLATSAIVPQAEVTPLIQRNARCRGLLLGLLRKLRLE